ncbi:MAG: protein kinase [Bacilli bacterium]|nr:protein kinase [Bacilli bacterium]
MNVRGYELGEKGWKNNSASMTAIATKGGKKYFLKKYRNPVCPRKDESCSPKLYENNKRKFDNFVEARSSINAEIRKFAASGGDIIIPVDEFVYETDVDTTYVEASEFVEGDIVKDEDVVDTLKRLSFNDKKLLLITTTGALRTVHSHHIVHSDLKLTNVLLVKDKHGMYAAKLIDFDSSYFVGKVPEEVVGDMKFFSPELGILSMNSECEDDELLENLRANMTTKSDIFSLGIILHYYLTGESPTYSGLADEFKPQIEKSGGDAYLWAALLCNAKLEISSKITEPLYRKLIAAMLRVDKDQRPDADTVLKAIKFNRFDDPFASEEDVRVTSGGGSTSTSSSDDAERRRREEEERRRREEAERRRREEEERSRTRITREATFAEPWPEHNITFNEEKIRSRGYVGLVREELNGIKGYGLYSDIHQETTQFRNVNTLISLGYAEKKAPKNEREFSVCEPWPEHAIEFDADMIKAKGWIAVERDASTGVKLYKFTPVTGVPRLINVNNCILLKLAKRI